MRPAIGQIQLGQQQPIGGHHLGARLGVALEHVAAPASASTTVTTRLATTVRP